MDVKMYQRLAQEFKRKTGADVEVTPLAWGSFETKYFTAMAAGLPPDIGVTNLGGPYNYGVVGGLVDLRTEFPQQIKALESQFEPQVLDMFTDGSKLYGVPSDLSLVAVYYRTDIFRQLHLEPPRTWSELNRVIDKLEANHYRYYYGFTSGSQWSDTMFTMPYGQPRYVKGSDGFPHANWNTEGYQKGMMEAMRLWNMHDTPGHDLSSLSIGMFRSNEPDTAVPMMIDIHAVAGSLAQTAPELAGKWGVVPWPRADDGKAYNIVGGTAYVIFSRSHKKRLAFQWLMFLNSVAAQREMILDHANRGDDSSLMVSSVLPIWQPGNDAFWQNPRLASEQSMRRVVEEAFPSFGTLQSMHGEVDASRLESNLLDQMASYIRDKLDAMASQRGISRRELIRRMSAGQMEADRTALDQDVAARLKREYAAITPAADRLLREETEKYQSRYGRIIRQLSHYERKRSVLDVIERVTAVLLVCLLALPFVAPPLRKHLASYLFIAPPLLLAVIFVFVPAATALYLSFTAYHPVLPLSTATWIGTANYVEVAHSGDLSSAIRRTIVYAVCTLPVGICLAVGLAYLLNNRLRGERYWRFVYFSPLVTSVVSIALIFTQLFQSGSQGWLNALLLNLKLVRDPVPFLTSEHTFLQCVIVLAIWHGLAFTILVFLAGLQQIPTQLYEAADVDGAGPLRKFWNVALPGLRPQMLFVTVLGFIGSFQVFETIYMLAGKSGDAGARFGPDDSALTMVPLIYHTGFETFEMGKSAAIAYVLFALILVITAIQFGYYRRKEV
jgi:ABC-type sugar transport system permease subunit/ABC-type glycerol-3-phosphate transport system substrate-binding protein